MAVLPKIVVDASVVVKWFLDDEEEVAAARRLRDQFVSFEVQVLAPSLIFCEVGNAFLVAHRLKRLTLRSATAKLQDFLDISLPVFFSLQTLKTAFNLASKHQLSVYDALYVALAHFESCDFYTGDRRLYRKLRRKLPWVRWVGDYGMDKSQP